MKCVICKDNDVLIGRVMCADCTEQRQKAYTQLKYDLAGISSTQPEFPEFEVPTKVWKAIAYGSLGLLLVLLLILWRFQ